MTCELCNKSWFSRRLVKGKLQTVERFWKFCGKTAWHQFPLSSSRFRNTVWALTTRVYFVQKVFKKAITVCFCFCQAGFLVTFCHQKVTENTNTINANNAVYRNVYHRTAEQHIGCSLRAYCKFVQTTIYNKQCTQDVSDRYYLPLRWQDVTFFEFDISELKRVQIT